FIGAQRSTFNALCFSGLYLSISVPSSSGLSVQRSCMKIFTASRRVFLSSLYRGSALNIQVCGPQDTEVVCQSPLHRGSAFNLSILWLLHLGVLFLSPLLLGSAFTATFCVVSGALQQYFSPLFIGAQRSTTVVEQSPEGNTAISVPSSSGLSVQLSGS